MKNLVDVVQLGARMHYAVPKILFDSNRLGRFFTDIWIDNHPFFHFLAKLPKSPLNKLKSRSHHELPKNFVTDYFQLGLEYASKLRQAKGNREAETHAFLDYGTRFQSLILESSLLNSPTIYAFNSVAKLLFESEKNRNKTKVLEQTLVPRITEHSLLQEEFDKYNLSLERGSQSKRYEQLELDECKLADIVLVGSNFVKESLIEQHIQSDKIKVVPYGYSLNPSISPTIKTFSSSLKILFVGNGGVRKGLHFALDAISRMKSVHFTIAGMIEPFLIKQFEQYPHIRFLGSVDRDKMKELYTSNDVLLLPSLCEGSATVSYEALAYGLPVLCTPNSGTVIESGYDGLLFPIRSTEVIRESIETIISKPKTLSEMSENAISTSKKYTTEEYGKRLLAAIE